MSEPRIRGLNIRGEFSEAEARTIVEALQRIEQANPDRFYFVGIVGDETISKEEAQAQIERVMKKPEGYERQWAFVEKPKS